MSVTYAATMSARVLVALKMADTNSTESSSTYRTRNNLTLGILVHKRTSTAKGTADHCLLFTRRIEVTLQGMRNVATCVIDSGDT